MTVLSPDMTTNSARAADRWPRKTWTHHDLDRMAEAGLIAPDERVELIEGEIYPMPAKGNRHERVRLAVNVWLYEHLGRDKIVLPEAGWRPALRDYLEPDFLIVPRHVVPPEFPGSDVLLAIEIADSSFGYDTTIKRNRYAALGVMEYWVIHAWELTTRIHRAPVAGGYAQYEEQPPSARLTPSLAPELVLALTDLGIE
jgi:Uma2 family endonuclease